MRLDEVYKYKDVFIPRIRLDVNRLSSITYGLSDDLKREAENVIGDRFTLIERTPLSEGATEKFVLMVQVEPVDYSVHHRCMMLRKDNCCELQLKKQKPQTCQVVPFSTFTPECMLPAVLQTARKSFCSEIFENPSSDADCEIIYQNGKVNFESNLGKALLLNQNLCKKGQPILMGLINILVRMEDDEAGFYEILSELLGDDKKLTIAFIPMLEYFILLICEEFPALVPSGFTMDTIKIFCKSQVALIDREIEKALQRKKQERTCHYKRASEYATRLHRFFENAPKLLSRWKGVPMEQAPSFFYPSSYWELDRALREIMNTESWLVSNVKDFFGDFGQDDLSEEIAPQGMAALSCAQKYRQDEIPFLFDRPFSELSAAGPLAPHVPFTMKNLSRLISVYEIWSTIAKYFGKHGVQGSAPPFSKDSFLAVEQVAKSWKRFCISLHSRETFLTEFKVDALSGLLFFLQEILQGDNQPLANLAKKIDIHALSCFPSFEENLVSIHVQMRSLAAVYILCGICESERKLFKNPDVLDFGYWSSVTAILKLYPFLDALKSSEFSSHPKESLKPITQENHKEISESVQFQVTIHEILDTL